MNSGLIQFSGFLSRAQPSLPRPSTASPRIPSPFAAPPRRPSTGHPHYAAHAIPQAVAASRSCAHFAAPIPPVPAASPARAPPATHSSPLSLRWLRSVCGTSTPSLPASARALLHRAASDREIPSPSSIVATPTNQPAPKPLSSSPKSPARSRPRVRSLFFLPHTSPACRFRFSTASSPPPQTPPNLPRRLFRTPRPALSQSPAPAPRPPLVVLPRFHPARTPPPTFLRPVACLISFADPAPSLPSPAP